MVITRLFNSILILSTLIKFKLDGISPSFFELHSIHIRYVNSKGILIGDKDCIKSEQICNLAN